MADDPLQHRAHADLIAQRAADQLRELLRTVASQIDPFPPFPGSMFSYGIEVEGIAAQDRYPARSECDARRLHSEWGAGGEAPNPKGGWVSLPHPPAQRTTALTA